MFWAIKEQIDTIFKEDPAAKSTLEVLLCYPGLHAVLLHRVAHKLYLWRLPILARLVSQFSRLVTGIEIHPGARIGRRFFIDHGMGVVIGETSEIGDDVLMYQGVTLGGTGHEKGKRHPTIGNHVVIGTGAQVLGNIYIGDRSKIGAGSVVVKSAPPHSTIVGVPGRVLSIGGVTVKDEDDDMLEHGRLPDPVEQAINALTDRVAQLESELRTLRDEVPRPSL
jgi:serine O-acetyltransferase